MRTIQEKSFELDPDRKVCSQFSFLYFLSVTNYSLQKQLSLILEYIPGKITSIIDRLIALYRPDSLVVGTRGNRRFGFVSGLGLSMVQQGLGVANVSINSVSK